MSSARGVVGLDLDACLEGGEVIPEKSEIVEEFMRLGGYAEISPSGTGLRQFLRGARLEDFGNRGRAGTRLEVYGDDDGRFLTITGHPYPPGSKPRPVGSNQVELEAFITRWCDVQQATGGASGPGGEDQDQGQPHTSSRSAVEVLKLLKTHSRRGRVTRLLAGDLTDHDGDHSAADLDLMQEVAYFCRQPEVLDAVMRGSGLMRPKWDERRGKATYGERTIQTALRKQTRNFDDDQAAKAQDAQRMTTEAGHLEGGGDDLRTRRGWRSDLHALTQLLVRDKRLHDVVFFDDFAGWPVVSRNLREVLDDRSAPTTMGRIQDAHLAAVCRWFGKSWGLRVQLKDVAAAVEGWARVRHRNPVVERLNELGAGWDGVQRLNTWLIDYCDACTKTDDGLDVRPYVQAVGARWLISVVARAMQPGAKVDSMLILEGRQGARKSSAARVLTEAIGQDYFREGFSLGGGGKDDLIALRGRLVIEWGELSGMGKRDREHLKNFLSQQTDSYRAIYGVTETDWPRTAVFIGTTNEAHYLADATGNRRFWPVRVGRIDLERLRRDAPRLWGEAVRRHQAGERWWFDDADPADVDLLRLAQGEQSRRVGVTLWTEVAQDLADQLLMGTLDERDGGKADAVGSFGVPQVRDWLARAAGVEVTDSVWTRVAEGLKSAGWESVKSGGRMRWRLSLERREQGAAVLA